MLNSPYSNSHQTISNPAVPYTGDIPGGMATGKKITINGVLTGDQVKINLRTPNAIALHINPRLSQKCVVRNSQTVAWGAEEKDGPMPFQKGLAFEIGILVDNHQYHISVNGQPAYTFRHRVPFQEVTSLNIVGDAHIQRIVYASGDMYNPNVFYNPALPFSSDIQYGLGPGKQLLVSGVLNGDQLKIDLKTTSGIALHVNARVNQKCVVRNTQSGAWGPEEKSGPMPFAKGQAFEVVIAVEDTQYQIAVNGQHAFTYRHRVPYKDVRSLAVSGDVTIQRIVI